MGAEGSAHRDTQRNHLPTRSVRPVLVAIGTVLVMIAALWVVILLILPVYVEPGNGSLDCGRPWRAAKTESFLEPSCHRAIERRRAVLLVPAGLATMGVASLLVSRGRRGERHPPGQTEPR